MTIEEKAKAYDEAKLRMSAAYNSNRCTIGFMNEIFPELKESEDEKIRKWLIRTLKGLNSSSIEIKGAYEMMLPSIAYLEKQGEQKPVIVPKFKIGDTVRAKTMKGFVFTIKDITDKQYVDTNDGKYDIEGQDYLELVEQKHTDKVEPKFKVGDWVVYCGKTCKITGLHNGIFTITNQDGSYFFNQVESTTEPVFHFWTIQDAKDGDVLIIERGRRNNECLFIFKDIAGREVLERCYYRTSDNTFSPTGYYIGYLDNIYHPATKEQRDLLFKKIKEAGYEWDAKKKELKKIEKKYTPKHKISDTVYYNSFGEVKSMIVANVVTDSTDNPMYEDENGYAVFEKALIEPKPAWREEDETSLINIIIMLKEGASLHFNKNDITKAVNWLKSLKDRIQPQPKQEWRQDNVEELTEFENAMMHIGDSFFGENAGLDPNDTKAIKEQANILLELVPKQEWSEEDESCLITIINELEVSKSESKYETNTYEKLISWLKSLRPQKYIWIDKVKFKEEIRYWFGQVLCHYENEGCPEDNMSECAEYFVDKACTRILNKTQKQWRPSDDQMDALRYVTDFDYGGHKATLVSLYEQLKKLK